LEEFERETQNLHWTHIRPYTLQENNNQDENISIKSPNKEEAFIQAYKTSTPTQSDVTLSYSTSRNIDKRDKHQKKRKKQSKDNRTVKSVRKLVKLLQKRSVKEKHSSAIVVTVEGIVSEGELLHNSEFMRALPPLQSAEQRLRLKDGDIIASFTEFLESNETETLWNLEPGRKIECDGYLQIRPVRLKELCEDTNFLQSVVQEEELVDIIVLNVLDYRILSTT
jgi:hypothetical protein